MPAPTFICIGVQKGGSTSFISYMNQHPEVYMREKEVHYFDSKELTPRNTAKYESEFTPRNKTIIGEKTPSYCYLQYAINRIHTYNPNIKLILLLREPIARAYSQYNLNYPKKLDSFLTSVMLEKDVKLKDITFNHRASWHIVRGFYDEHIEYILSKFPRENLHIAISEEVHRNKNIEYNKIYQFLGATKTITVDDTADTNVRSYAKPLSKQDARILYDIYKPHNEKLYSILGRKIDIWEDYYKKLME
jgi:hypothetical protein